tara:strand:+ start:252 stop:623 length:372 start_codon:yes stop_codon:yes gene_type:complete
MTENFNIMEFASKDGADFPQDVIVNLYELAKNLEVIRAYYEKPIKVNSGYRSPNHNKSVKGSVKSQHLLGKAGDLVIEGITPKQLANGIQMLIDDGEISEGGIGIYNSFTHYDIRGTKARWEL